MNFNKVNVFSGISGGTGSGMSWRPTYGLCEISTVALSKCQKRISPSKVAWKRVKLICILGEEKGYSGRKPGIYINETKELVLIFALDNVRDYVIRCTDQLYALSCENVAVFDCELGHLSGLHFLSITNVPDVRTKNLKSLCNLQFLRISKSQLTTMDGFVLPDHLEKLILRDNPLTNLRGVVFPPAIRHLDLSLTNINYLPESIRQLTQLEVLTIRSLQLRGMPYWLSELNLPVYRESATMLWEGMTFDFGDDVKGIYLGDTTIEGIDMSVFDQSQEVIAQWLSELWCHGEEIRKYADSISITDYIQKTYWAPRKDWSSFSQDQKLFRWKCARFTPSGGFLDKAWNPDEYSRAYREKTPKYYLEPEDVSSDPDRNPIELSKPLNELKIVFLGDGEAGKSHTIARLLEDGKQVKKFRGDSTPGIVIEDKLYKIGDRQVKVHYWDFGGQEILHSMHRMFLTKRTLYVVLLNVREGNQDDRARYWLYNLRSFADGAPVLLVLNKMDMNKNASINEADLRKLYPGLTDVVKLSTLTYSDEKFQKEFVEVLTERIGKMNILAFPFIDAWNRVKEKLQNMKKNYILGEEFRAYCDDAGVKGSDAVRRDLLEWFSDLGVSFCYSDEDSLDLEDHVVLRPDWITNALYIILFNKVEAVDNGLVSHDTIYRMLSSEDTVKYRRTVATARYEREEVDYVLKVFRKFRLSFLVEDGVEFLPMLCDANSTAAAAEYENDPNALEFRMYYEYLPNNVIHRLMVERRKELDRGNVWLTGARFVCGDTGRSAVVKSEGNLIRILVRADKEPRDPQRYLDELKESLERINEIMGLTVESMEVVYKENGKTAYFDYADLMFAQDMGETQILCRELRKRIRLVDVLMQSDFPADEKQKKLMADIRQACEKLQSRMIYWNASEDVRTDYLMDMLTTSGYTVLDQHRTGISAGGIQSGELDLDIRLTPGDAWSALEALNLKGSSPSQIEYWNAHLKKLLDNYNDVGRAFLFHVSYVQCPKDKFGKIMSDMYEHMRFYSPRGFELLRRFVSPVSFGNEREQNQFLRVVKCVYDCGGVVMTVYQFFVRIGE